MALPALPRVIAHRCGGALAPENTLAGLRIAAVLGLRAVEFDVMLSADGTPVVIHDETLERTTDGHGLVSATHDAQLLALDAGGRHHRSFAGERVPTLVQIAACCRQLGLWANIEIKPAGGYEALTGEVVARQAATLWQGAESPLLSSFSLDALAAARRAAPGLPRGLLFDTPPDDWRTPFAELAAHTLHCAAHAASDALLAAAQADGIPLLCYTVNDPAQARALLQRGVAAVFSDRIDLFDLFVPMVA